MSDSIKKKRPIHCPLFLAGFFFHMQSIANCKELLYIYSRESFLKDQDVQWIYWSFIHQLKKPPPKSSERELFNVH